MVVQVILATLVEHLDGDTTTVGAGEREKKLPAVRKLFRRTLECKILDFGFRRLVKRFLLGFTAKRSSIVILDVRVPFHSAASFWNR
jgi:hypothetical protein